MVKTCCFGCYPVDTGTAIIATIEIISGIFKIFGFVLQYYLGRINEMEHQIGPLYTRLGYWVPLVLTLTSLTVSCFLLQGFKTKNPHLCKPWLYWNAVWALFIAGLAIYGQPLEPLEPNNWTFIILLYTSMGIYMVMHLYFLGVVQSFILEVERGAYAPPSSEKTEI